MTTLELLPFEAKGMGTIRQLRRPVLETLHPDTVAFSEFDYPEFPLYVPHDKFDRVLGRGIKSPFGRVGELLVCLERYTVNGDRTYYEAKDAGDGTVKIAWMDAETLPPDRSRFTITPVEIRVEKLGTVTEDGAEREGCRDFAVDMGLGDGCIERVSALDVYRQRWNANFPDHPWADGLWTWVMKFEVQKI